MTSLSPSRKRGLRFSSDYVRHWTHVKSQIVMCGHIRVCVLWSETVKSREKYVVRSLVLPLGDITFI